MSNSRRSANITTSISTPRLLVIPTDFENGPALKAVAWMGSPNGWANGRSANQISEFAGER